MKKLLITLMLMFTITPAFAAKAIVECLEDFSTEDPSSYFMGRVVQEVEFENGILLRQNAIMKAEVVGVVEAKRAKRNAYVIVKPVAYYDPELNKVYKVQDSDWEAKVVGYKPFDVKDTAKKAGIGVANFFVQGFGTVYHFGEGVLNPKDDENRFKSGVKNAYENSILSYVEQGKPLVVNKGDYLALKFYQADVPKWKFWERNQ